MGNNSGVEVVRGEMTPTRVPASVVLGGHIHFLNCPDLVPGIGEGYGYKRPGCLKLEVVVKLPVFWVASQQGFQEPLYRRAKG
jgi:hypothetical protein